jgi:tetratricopeptide (TPR) repeat protein
MSNLLAEELFLKADEQIANKQYAQANETLLKLIQEYPTFGKAYNHLGWMYETKAGDFQVADELYQKALEYAPDYRAIYYNYAVVLSTMQRWPELESLLKKAEAIPGINMGTLYNEYAIMHEVRGNYDKAIEYCMQGIQATFDERTLENFSKSLARCKKKKEIVNQYKPQTPHQP